MWIELSEGANNVKIFISHMNAYQRVSAGGEDVNNQVYRI